MTLKLGQEGKQVFIDCYNDSTIPWNQLNKEIRKRLFEKGLVSSETKLTSKFVREVYETKLNMLYKNRPKGPKGPKSQLDIEFDETDNTSCVPESIGNVLPLEETEDVGGEKELIEELVDSWDTTNNPIMGRNSDYDLHAKEPSKFNF